ncbi:hypothetical protein Hanom_Chr03g00195881 [Helianthus anomalus]
MFTLFKYTKLHLYFYSNAQTFQYMHANMLMMLRWMKLSWDSLDTHLEFLDFVVVSILNYVVFA